MKKKIAIVGTSGLPPKYGGFETLANYLNVYKGNDIELYVFCKRTRNKLENYQGTKLIYLPFNSNGVQSIIYDAVSIIISWLKFDGIIILGTPGCFILPLLNKIRSVVTVINFGGLEWKREKWNVVARFFLKYSEKLAVFNSTFLVVDNKSFQNYVMKEYNKNSELIMYGGDHTKSNLEKNKYVNDYKFLDYSYYISVSRAQVDNNLHLILETFAKKSEEILVLISNWDSSQYGIDLKNKYSSYNNLHLLDAIYDRDILDTLRSNAKAYIHTHKYCGTAPSLVEAMSLGLPIISFDMETNLFTTENEAIYFKTSADLFEIISNTSESKFRYVAQKMKEIADEKYVWSSVTKKYFELFNQNTKVLH